MKKEKNDVVIMASTYDEVYKVGTYTDVGLKRIFLHVAQLQEINDHDWAVNNWMNNNDENPTVYTVILLK